MKANKMKLAPLLLLFPCHRLLHAAVDGLVEVAGADAFVCDILFVVCLGSCWKSSNCKRCCKHHGFVHGRCSLKHGDGCYCCRTPDPDPAGVLD